MKGLKSVSPANGVDPEDEDEDEDDRLLVPDQTGGIVVVPIWREIWAVAADAGAGGGAGAGQADVLQLEDLEQLLCGILWYCEWIKNILWMNYQKITLVILFCMITRNSRRPS